MDWLLLLVIIPFIGSLAFWFFPKNSLAMPRILSLVITTIALMVLGFLTLQWSPDSPTFSSLSWIPEIGLHFNLWLDGPALFYAWLVLGIGWLVFWYAGYYMDPNDSPWRFYGVMVIFMGAMLGVVTSRNALLMFVFWELTSISSFLLIGHWHEKASARAGALRALVTTAGGGLALLTGLAVVGYILHDVDGVVNFDWDHLWASREAIMEHSAAPWALVLMLIGAFSKSAQFPFHYWLPGAMEAPTPVSAYLHAATMVKAGIYLLGRMYPIFSEHILWLAIVATVGVLTMTFAGFMAIMAKDLKQLLAYSTVSQLGLLTAYYGFGFNSMHNPEHMLKMDLLLVASHAFFKGALFMLVGVIDHGIHTRDWTRMGGLIKKMPGTAVLTILGCLSMAGVPLTFGFVAKELFLHASLHLQTDQAIWNYLPFLAVFSSIFTVAYCYRMIVSPFFGKPRDESLHPHEGSIGMLFSPAVLIGLCVLGGLYVPLLEKPLSAMTNSEFYSAKSGFTFAMFKYIDPIFWIAVFLFLVGGPIVHFTAGKIEAVYKKMGSPAPSAQAYDLIFLTFVPWFAKTSHGLIQSPSLRRNVMVTLTAFIALMAWPVIAMLRDLSPVEEGQYLPINLLKMTIAFVSVGAIVFILSSHLKLLRLISLSVVGIMVSLYFLAYKAPDLMLTQVLVEIASLFMFLLLLSHLPRLKAEPERKLARFTPAVIAVCVGLIFGILNFAAVSSPDRGEPILEGNLTAKEYYLANAKEPMLEGDHAGGGYNVVNVILVDFRGIDTFGEIIVLGIAALGVISLLMLRKSPEPEFGKELFFEQDLGRSSHIDTVPVSQIFSRKIMDNAQSMIKQYAFPVSFLILSLAAVLFFAGHNTPGGGFIAGLLTVVGFAPYFLYYNRHKHPYGKRHPLTLVPWGMIIAAGTGVASVAFGSEFLKSAYTSFDLPLIGYTAFSSAVIFDLGVYLIVVGTGLILIRTFGRH